MREETLLIASRRCLLFEEGFGGPCIYWGVSSGADAVTRQTVLFLCKLCPSTPFRLISFECADWNRDFSPWPASLSGLDGDFSGEGPALLDWLLHACLPKMSLRFPNAPSLIGGYSLCGLFSLWAFYESEAFAGACSCSGSLWYPGWAKYTKDHSAKQQSYVYLSLGRKEEKTKNPYLSAVGSATRQQFLRLQDDPLIVSCDLIWHPGGHFSDVSQRVAQGFSWLLEKTASVSETNSNTFPSKE